MLLDGSCGELPYLLSGILPQNAIVPVKWAGFMNKPRSTDGIVEDTSYGRLCGRKERDQFQATVIGQSPTVLALFGAMPSPL